MTLGTMKEMTASRWLSIGTMVGSADEVRHVLDTGACGRARPDHAGRRRREDRGCAAPELVRFERFADCGLGVQRDDPDRTEQVLRAS